MGCPENYLYTKEHEWILIKGETATVGITEFAQEELGEIVFVELPEIGQSYSKGDSICVLESTKAASDVYAPFDGTVVAVNEELSDEPTLINTSPYKKGWMVKFEGVSDSDVEELLSFSDYEDYIEA